MKKRNLLFCILIVQLNTIFAQYHEIYRPQFHFTPPSMWMNDPNGLLYYKGKYHLFYQYYPNDIVWGPMHWGHAESTDLLHWKQLPIALYPDQLGWIFSGSAVIDQYNSAGFGVNAMVAIFTYHNDEIVKQGRKNPESQGIAYSLDEGLTWTKYDQNPVLNNSGEQDFRDPKVFWNESTSKWVMTLAVGNQIKFFSSTNLKSWQHESTFKPEDDLNELGVWECPDLFSIKTDSGETKWVLIVNHGDKGPNGGSGTRYFVGDFDGKTFQSTQKSIWMDYGTDFYAAVTYANVPNNRRILLGWMSNWQYATKVPTTTWRSAMTLPRELTLVKKGTTYSIEQKVTDAIQSIASSVLKQSTVALPFQKDVDLSQTQISFDLDKSTTDLSVVLTNAKGELFTITLNANQLTTNREKSGLVDFYEGFKKEQVLPFSGVKIRTIQLLLDKSSVEIILNNGEFTMTNLVFPTTAFTVLKINGIRQKRIKNLQINTLKSIWN